MNTVIDREHLAFIIKSRCRDESTAIKLLGGVSREDQASIDAALALLSPSERAHLEAEYDLDSVRSALSVFRFASIPFGAVMNLRASHENKFDFQKMRIRNFRHNENRVEGLLEVQVPHSYTSKGERVSTLRDMNVQFIIRKDIHSKGIQFESYTSSAYARKAADKIQAFLVARMGLTGDNDWTMVRFGESDIKGLAKKHSWAECGVMGSDAQGNLGKVAYNSQVNGRLRDAFPASDAKSSLQSRASNHSRDYVVGYTHADGYQEQFEVRFYFGKFPHLLILTKCSRSAIQSVVDMLP